MIPTHRMPTIQSGPVDLLLITPYGVENRGIRYVAAALRRAGFKAAMVFFKRWVNNDIREPSDGEYELLARLAADLRPRLIGFGFGAPYLTIVTKATQLLRRRCQVPVLWGGVHPTVCPEECIDIADFVCVGEGEEATVELLQALLNQGDPATVPGIWSRRDGKVCPGTARPLIQELDSLPFPACMDGLTWFIEDGRIRREDPVAGTVEYRIYPARGCPYQCSYCHSHVIRRITRELPGRFYRFRSVANVIAELEVALATLPRIRRVKFDSDVFAFPRRWIEEFAREYGRRIAIPFELLTYPGELDEQDLRLLKEAGLRKIQTGIQSGSDRVVAESYGRKSTSGDILKLSGDASRAGVEIAYDLIFDNPQATAADKRAVVELLLQLHHPFTIYLYSLTLFPRTRLAQEFLAAGLVTPEQIEGRATKSFRQFRLSFDYPRSPEEQFWIALTILAAKRGVPRPLVRALMELPALAAHPAPLVALARAADLAKVATIAGRMLLDGELTLFKLRQYGSLKRMISQ